MNKNKLLSIIIIALTILAAIWLNTEIIKFLIWAVWLSFIILIVLQRKTLRTKRAYLLLISIFIFGILLGASPNAMESIISFFTLTKGMEGNIKIIIVSLALFTMFSIWGNKLFCGWGCQLGALQESLFNIPFVKSKYKIKVPFLISLTVRIIIFTAFLSLLYGWFFGTKDFVIFHNINLFKIFDLALPKMAIIGLPILSLLFFFTYRPFCHFICPFGLYSWALEKIAFNKITINHSGCISCQKCVKVCPTEAMSGILNKQQKYSIADCWSCGKCIDSCPRDVIYYK